MKRIVISLCLIIGVAMSGGVVAQNDDVDTDERVMVTSQTTEQDSIKSAKWTNPIDLFVGVWSLERTITDAEGDEVKMHPGTFMIVHPNASYTIFVYTDIGAVITSKGNILVESPNEYIEVISQHVNSSLVGVSNRIDYKLGINYLQKSFWVEKDREGGDYKREVHETWKRAMVPESGAYEDNPAFPI